MGLGLAKGLGMKVCVEGYYKKRMSTQLRLNQEINKGL